MTVSLDDMMARLDPARRRKIEDRSAELIAEEMTLRELRKARQLTQLSVARELGISQHGVSRLEQRSDLLLSTLRRTVEAMGASLSLIATFPDRPPVELSGIAARETRDRLYLRRRAPLPGNAPRSPSHRTLGEATCQASADRRETGGWVVAGAGLPSPWSPPC